MRIKRQIRVSKPILGVSKTTLYLSIAEYMRIDGRPRTKIIKYLGRISANPGRIEAFAYWERTTLALDHMALESCDRVKLEQQLACYVPRISADKVQDLLEGRKLREAKKAMLTM
jgi:hypothetical protein